jgi:hypothetical protein
MLTIFLPVVFFLIGCNDDVVPTSSATDNTSMVVTYPKVILSDSVNFKVESACIGMTGLASDSVKGIIKIKYLGSADLNSLNIFMTFKDKNNIELQSYSTMIRNVISCYSNYLKNNTNYFLTSKYNIGYIFIRGTIGDFKISKLQDLSKIQITISSTPFTYAPALGTLSKTGDPYKDNTNHWCQNVINNGDRKIQIPYYSVILIYKDSENRLFKWDFPMNYVNGKENFSYEIGESGFFKGQSSYLYDLKMPFSCVETCLSW